jgi:hypothetical protein
MLGDMPAPDSPNARRSLNKARALVAQPARNQNLGPVLGAAAFFALSALALAATVIAIPPQWR